jgi:hypothetical protein
MLQVVELWPNVYHEEVLEREVYEPRTEEEVKMETKERQRLQDEKRQE